MPRAREIGITVGPGEPGLLNAITDVSGVEVGYETLVEGDAVRTGVTVIVPFGGLEALFAGCHRLNGNGEMTGLQWVRESGMLTTPIAITNTLSVGAVHEGLIRRWAQRGATHDSWSLPVVAETWDGVLNDIGGLHVRPHHVAAALDRAHGGPIEEGNVGGGTGMICHGFKGGSGTSSRVVGTAAGTFTVGVFVQANYGSRAGLRVDGVPVGREIGPDEVPLPGKEGTGSIIVIVATDAPLLPFQCDRLAQRAGLGVGRMGGVGGDSSGDLFLAFTTGNRGLPLPSGGPPEVPVRMLNNELMDGLFAATIEATEESILNALLSAGTMTGAGGRTAHRLPPRRLLEVMERYGRHPAN